MKKLMQAKHWQVFFGLLIVSLLQGMSEDVFFDTFFYSLFLVSYVGWLLLLGTWLRGVSPNPKMNYPVFIVSGLALIAVLITHRIIAASDVTTSGFFEGTFMGLLMTCYILTSLISLTSYIGKNLKAIEAGGEVEINDYFNDILSLIFWPIGIWMFQPRINKLELRISGHIPGERDSDLDSGDALEQSDYVRQTFTPRTINRLIGYGILMFLIGFFVGANWIKYLQLLIPAGSLMTFIGVFYYLKQTDLQEEFRMDANDHALAYFWDVIVLKLWTCMFLIWMIVLNLMLIATGWL